MKLKWIILGILCSSFSFAAPATAAAVKAEQEACLSADFLPANAVTIWEGQQTHKVVGTAEVASGPLLTVGQRADLTLIESAKLKLFTPTRKTGKEKGTQGHGGFFQFKTLAEKSDYTIAAPKGVWLEIVDLADQHLVDSSDHDMVGDCKLYHKLVRFPLQANHQYGLQVSGVEDAKTSLLLVQAPAK